MPGLEALGLEEQTLPRTVPLECSTLVLSDAIPRPEGLGLSLRVEERRSRGAQHAGPMVSMDRSDARNCL